MKKSKSNFVWKRTVNILLTLVTFLTFTGFRGCQDIEVFYHIIMTCVIGTGFYAKGDNTETNYSIACGEGGAIYTCDGRPPAPWIERSSGTTRKLNSVNISGNSDTSVAFAVGNFGTVLRSSDKGHTWQNRSLPSYATEDLFGLDFIQYPNNSTVHVVAVGDSGKVFRSNNYGSNWVWYEYFPNTIRKLKSVVAVNHELYVAVGEHGIITRTTNAGETWQNISVIDTNTFNKIVQVRYDIYLIIGNNGKMFRSTNYGAQWQNIPSGTTKHLRDALFKNENEGIVVGDDGTVRNTTNGGATWTTDSYLNGLTTRDIISVSRVDSVSVNSITRNTGLTDNQGSDTTVFHAVSSDPFIGIEPISGLIAEVFTLSQNYPNPFNPVTNISVSIPKTSYTKLIVYDIQGKEIELLVNKVLSAGSYKIDWNASSYPSGVYFYKIITEEFTETKKMILIK